MSDLITSPEKLRPTSSSNCFMNTVSQCRRRQTQLFPYPLAVVPLSFLFSPRCYQGINSSALFQGCSSIRKSECSTSDPREQEQPSTFAARRPLNQTSCLNLGLGKQMRVLGLGVMNASFFTATPLLNSGCRCDFRRPIPRYSRNSSA